ncbi:unnamed protein product [Linum trigynum]|uniref:Uncharacterized protein n=1 Tax=Linum trigynum TaxID=586398 RepID=A0AAV2GJF1_9ROSI
MLVQDRLPTSPPPPKSPKSNSKSKLPTTVFHHPISGRRFSPAKSLDFCTWFSDNLYKIVTIAFLVATVAALFFLRNAGDTSAFLYLQSKSHPIDKTLRIGEENVGASGDQTPRLFRGSSKVGGEKLEDGLDVGDVEFGGEELGANGGEAGEVGVGEALGFEEVDDGDDFGGGIGRRARCRRRRIWGRRARGRWRRGGGSRRWRSPWI